MKRESGAAARLFKLLGTLLALLFVASFIGALYGFALRVQQGHEAVMHREAAEHRSAERP